MGEEEFRKKDEVTFYFNREEYTRRRHAHREVPAKTRPFKENKTLWIILLDIGVIFLFVVVLLPLLRKPYSIKNFDGYSLKLMSFISNGRVYTVLDATENGKKKNIQNAEQHIIKIQFYSEGKKGSYSISDFLPEKGKTASYSHFFHWPSAEKMYARVQIGKDTILLRVKVTE